MKLTYGALTAAILSASLANGFAVTLTNHDTTEQKFIMIEGDAETTHTIKAGEKLTLCEKSCVIRMPNGDDYEFDGPEIVSLEDGILFLDSPGAQGQASR